ncbi:hypothetical protein ACROYT_G018921 [Oculina patagonica]
MVKGKDGRLLTKEDEVKDRWREHFVEVLNRPVPEVAVEVEEANEVNDSINTGAITKDEIRSSRGDSIHGSTTLKIMGYYGIPSKIMRMMQAMYINCTSAVVDIDERTDWFEKHYLRLRYYGYHLRYENDARMYINGKGKSSFKISTTKTKLIRINANNNNAIIVYGQQVEDVDSFDYLGARITKYGGAEDDIKSRLGKAKGAFNKLILKDLEEWAIQPKYRDKNL